MSRWAGPPTLFKNGWRVISAVPGTGRRLFLRRVVGRQPPQTPTSDATLTVMRNVQPVW